MASWPALISHPTGGRTLSWSEGLVTSLALIFISGHARFILQLQQSGILSLLLFIHLKPEILSENIFKPLFTSLHLVAPSNLSSTLIHSTE